MDAEHFLSPSEAAIQIQVSGQYIRKIMKQGKISYIWTSLGRLIEPSSLVAFQATRKSRTRNLNQSIETHE